MKKSQRYISLIEVMVALAIIAILISMLIPVLARARQVARDAVCVNNLNQLYKFQMFYADDNENKVYAHNLRSLWPVAPYYRKYDAINRTWVWEKFYEDGKQFMEPYVGHENHRKPAYTNAIYRCPATKYDPSSFTGWASGGKTYNGFMDIFYSSPSKIWDIPIRNYGRPMIVFQNSTRRPFIRDYTAPFAAMGSSKVHDDKGKLNLLVTDGSVIKLKLPYAMWDNRRTMDSNLIPYYESALGESAY